MSDDPEKLLPCPFCGGPAKVYIDAAFSNDNEENWQFNVRCVNCHASTQESKNRGYAIEYWNLRTPS